MTNARGLRELVKAQLPEAAVLREDLHRWPDLSGDEQETCDRLRAQFADLPFHPVAETGGILIGPGTAPRIGIRVELDALPIVEQTALPWASQRPGVMHACGHDVHAAAAVAVMRALSARQDCDSHPSVALILQPREEKPPSGARDVVHSGLLQELGIAAVVGAHLQPALPRGVISCTPGAVNASADEFTIEIVGRPGHGAYPHRCDDVVLAMAATVQAVQQIVARNVDPMQSAAITIGYLQAGSAANVLPGSAQAKGTIRALNGQLRDRLIARLQEVVQGMANAHGCSAELTVHGGEPALVNDDLLTLSTARILTEWGESVDDQFRSMGADDFSYYGEQIPALMMFVGVDDGRGGLHHPGFVPGNDSIDLTARSFLAGYLGAEELLTTATQGR
jgi:amidohydrolase